MEAFTKQIKRLTLIKISLLLLCVLNYFQVASQSTFTFACTGELYFSAVTNTAGTTTSLSIVQISGTSATFNTINIFNTNINGIGYNIVDHYLYAAAGSRIKKLGANNSTTISPNLSPGTSFGPAGDVDANGFFISVDGTGDTLYTVDLNTPAYTVTKTQIIPPNNANGSDIAVSPITGEIFVWVNNGIGITNPGLVKVNRTTGAVTQISNISTPGSIGTLSFVNGELYGYDNALLQLYKISTTAATSPTFIANGPSLNGSDGCACPYNVTLGQDVIASNDTICAGSSFDYSFIVKNYSGQNQVNVGFSDILDNRLSFSQSASAILTMLQGVYNSSPGTITVNISNAAGGINNSLTVTGLEIPNTPTTFTLGISSSTAFPNGYTMVANQASLTNLGSLFGFTKQSDYVQSLALSDATPLTFSKVGFIGSSANVNCANTSNLQSNGKITLSNYNNNYHYSLVTGNSYTGNATYASGSNTIALGGVIINTLNNPTVSQSYSIRLFDYLGCYHDSTYTLNHITTPNLSVGPRTNVKCFGNSTGAATVNVTGGAPSYNYIWSSSTNTSISTTSVANSLAAGNYTCSIQDNNTCKKTLTLSISQPSLLTATTNTQTVSCNGGSNGSATVIVSGGTAGYTYTWAPIASTSSVVNTFTAGTYTCTIKDANNCPATTTVSIVEPSPLSIRLSSQNVNCYGNITGTAAVTVSGGTSAYSYTWSSSTNTSISTSSVAINLAAGNYTCTIQDNNACIETITIPITQPNSALSTNISTQVISCNGGSDGSATITANGGTAGYTFSWSPITSTSSVITTFSAGVYVCIIKDANNCSRTKTVTIIEPTAITSTMLTQNINCFGNNNGSATVTAIGGTGALSYSWTAGSASGNSVNNLSPGNYTVTITDTKNCSKINTVNIIQPNSALAATETHSDNTNCIVPNGNINLNTSGGIATYSYNWSNGNNTASLSNLPQGTYNYTVTDLNSCTTTGTITLNGPLAPAIISSSVQNVTCYNGNTGSIATLINGANPPYNYSLNSISVASANNNNLTAGVYVFSASDLGGCNTSQTFTITEPSDIVSSYSVSKPCIGDTTGAIEISITGGAPGYSLQTSTAMYTNSYTAINNLGSGNYNFKITDANSCSDSITVYVGINNANDCAILIPEIFTPNGDTKNDFWEIKGIDYYPNNEVQIFNRWGNMIYSEKGYKNEWAGSSNVASKTGGGKLPSGTYYVIVNFGDNSKSIYKGFVQILY